MSSRPVQKYRYKLGQANKRIAELEALLVVRDTPSQSADSTSAASEKPVRLGLGPQDNAELAVLP